VKTRQMVLAGAVVTLACCCVMAASDGLKPLTGVFAISSTNVDPGPKDPRDTHFIIYLRGDSARSLYDALKGIPVEDICESDKLAKVVGGTHCSFNLKTKNYACSLAINIASQKIEPLAC
jgi:hypothetical protein